MLGIIQNNVRGLVIPKGGGGSGDQKKIGLCNFLCHGKVSFRAADIVKSSGREGGGLEILKIENAHVD